MASSRTKSKHTYCVNYSSQDGRNYGIIAVGYCISEAQALNKAKGQIMRSNPNAKDYVFAIA